MTPALIALAAAVREHLAADDAWRVGIGAYLPGEDSAAYVARRDAARAEVHRLRRVVDALIAGCP